VGKGEEEGSRGRGSSSEKFLCPVLLLLKTAGRLRTKGKGEEKKRRERKKKNVCLSIPPSILFILLRFLLKLLPEIIGAKARRGGKKKKSVGVLTSLSPHYAGRQKKGEGGRKCQDIGCNFIFLVYHPPSQQKKKRNLQVPGPRPRKGKKGRERNTGQLWFLFIDVSEKEGRGEKKERGRKKRPDRFLIF